MRAALNSADHLASLLAPAVRLGALAFAPAGDIDAVIESLQSHLQSGSAGHHAVPADLQFETAQRFWSTRQLPTLKDARLVAFGLGLPVGPDGACLLDDSTRFDTLLHAIDDWLPDPRRYRRCYQGLLWSYFNVDLEADGLPEATRRNGLRLREYLAQRAPKTVDKLVNPDWVKTVLGNRHLFGDAAGEPYLAKLLRGDRSELDALCAQLGIQSGSWFLRRLVQAQVTAALKLEPDAFCALLPALLELLSPTPATMRDAGLAALLERYAALAQLPPHDGLRDAAARWWGHPWHPASNALRWNGLTEIARAAATEWLKVDLIDRFFSDPNGALDPRRAVFWKRYSRSIQTIERASDGRSLTMTLGRIQLSTSCDLAAPLLGPDLELLHQDGQRGWRRWEQMFEDELKDQLGLRPGALSAASTAAFVDLADPVEPLAAGEEAPAQRWHTASAGEDVHWQTAEAALVPYTRPDLEVLARVHALRIDDELARSGRLWVRADDTVDQRIAQVLRRWGFTCATGEGWFRAG